MFTRTSHSVLPVWPT